MECDKVTLDLTSAEAYSVWDAFCRQKGLDPVYKRMLAGKLYDYAFARHAKELKDLERLLAD
jgi:hypothetical protein